MYNREKNNTSTTIYPKCHNTQSKGCLVSPMLCSPLCAFASSLSHISKRSLIHIHTHERAIRKLSTTGDHLYVGYGEKWQSCSSSSTEKRRRRRKEKKGEKKMSSFPILRNGSRPFIRSLACSFVCSLSCLALMSCTKEYPHAPCHTQPDSIEDMKMMWVARF